MTIPAAHTALPGETWTAAVKDTVGSWREMFDRRTAGRDVLAGVSTAMVALPLNVALALACGLPPAVGLVTGAIAGALSALLGGARLQVTGPEVALAPLTYAIVVEHGMPGLLAATFLAGICQIVLGVLRIGRFVKAIPAPVIGGFMAAVGLLVFNSQLPRLLGLTGVRNLSDIRSAGQLAPQLGTVAIGAAAVLTLVLLPKVRKSIPAPLVAMGAGVVAVLVGVKTPTLEPIASIAPSIGLPHFDTARLSTLVPEAIALALLASLDSLLCAAGMDARTGGPRVRTDQELVAQGLANMASACVGGMPVAAAIVRSAAAHEAGAQTRLAPLVQSVVLALVLVLLAAYLPLVPIAALAGILLVVGYRLIEWRSLLKTYAASRAEALIFVATAVAILATDFVKGVGAGILLAVIDFARRASTMKVSARRTRLPGRAAAGDATASLVAASRAAVAADGAANGAANGAAAHGPSSVASEEVVAPGPESAVACVVHLEGALFFGSHDDVERVVATSERARLVVIDLEGVHHADLTGAWSLARAVKRMVESGRTVRLYGARAAVRPLLEAAGLAVRMVADEAEALGRPTADPAPVAPAATSTGAKTETAAASVEAVAPEAAARAAANGGAPVNDGAKGRPTPARPASLPRHLQPSLE